MGLSAENLQPNVHFSGGNSTYCNGATARQSMIDNDNWTITDGGLDANYKLITTAKDENISDSVKDDNTILITFDNRDSANDVEFSIQGKLDRIKIKIQNK